MLCVFFLCTFVNDSLPNLSLFGFTNTMDDTLSRFISQTGTDPSLARDLLESTKWNLDDALSAFEALSLGAPLRSSDETSATKNSSSGKAHRGLSVVNSDIVVEARHKVINDEVPGTDERYESFEAMSDYTFVLPNLSNFPEDLSEFLWRDLIETSTLVALEQAGRLNWWTDVGVCQRLLPLATVGDGNCLLHAASLGMWGFHDRLLTLRKALYRTLTSHLAKGAIRRRWKLQQWQKNMEDGGLVFSEQEWEKEWQEVLRIASTQRRLDGKQKAAENSKGGETASSLPTIVEKDTELSDNIQSEGDITKTPDQTEKQEPPVDGAECKLAKGDVPVEDRTKDKEKPECEGGAFESLEDIHVFVLAHVLRRPIIIVADQFLCDFGGEPIAPIPFGGVYLPLEWEPAKCFKNPLVLAFDSAHFSPLVPSDERKEAKNSLQAAVPLVGPNYDLLPLQFSVDPGEEFVWKSLDEDSATADKLALTMDKKLELLKKYLDMETVKIPSTSKKDTQDESKTVSPSDKSEAGSSSSSKPAEKKERSWIATQLMKASTIAGVLGSVVHNTIFVAKLQTGKRPDYYDKMIENYIESAEERFEEEKKAKANASHSPCSTSERPQRCINPGCQLYGTSVTNYLCSGCFKAQRSYSEKGCYQGAGASGTETSSSGKTPVTNYDYHSNAARSYFPPPAYSPLVPYGYFGDNGRTQSSQATQENTTPSSSLSQPTRVQLNAGSQPGKQPVEGPPSYAEVTQGRQAVSSSIPTSLPGTSDATSAQHSYNPTGAVTKCAMTDCQFFGSPQNEGYCSACYKKYQQTLKYKAAPSKASS